MQWKKNMTIMIDIGNFTLSAHWSMAATRYRPYVVHQHPVMPRMKLLFFTPMGLRKVSMYPPLYLRCLGEVLWTSRGEVSMSIY